MIAAIPEIDLGAWLGQYLWPLARIGAFLLSMPILGSRMVPLRIRMIYSLMLTWVALPFLQTVPRCNPLGLECWLIVVQQLLIGLAMGFCFQFLFQLFEISGQLIATQSGLGFSSMVNPDTGVSVATISQLYSMLINLLFLAMDGHLILIDYLIRSFQVLPIRDSYALGIHWPLLFQSGGWMLSSALLVAMPAIVALLVVNLALAVTTRAAPQLNIFSVGFPVSLLVGLLVLWLSLKPLPEQFRQLADQMFVMLQRIFTG